MKLDPDYRGGIHHPDCMQGKLGYASKQDLKRLLKRRSDKFGKGGMNIYRCNTCDLYHYSSWSRADYLRGTS